MNEEEFDFLKPFSDTKHLVKFLEETKCLNPEEKAKALEDDSVCDQDRLVAYFDLNMSEST